MKNDKAPARASSSTEMNYTNIDKATKIERTLRALLSGKLHRFAAEKLGDHSLNSTISTLVNKHGVHVSRESIVLQGRFGTIYCKRYWIDPYSGPRK